MQIDSISEYHNRVCRYISAEYSGKCHKEYKSGFSDLNSHLDEILITCFLNNESVPNAARLIVDNYREINKQSKRK